MILGIMIVLSVLGSAGICWGSGAFGGLHWIWALPLSFAGLLIALGGLLFVSLWALTETIDLSKPQEKDDPFFRKLTFYLVQFVAQALRVHLQVEGADKMPKDGRMLLVCNHQSVLDPLMLLYVFHNSQLAFITKKEVSDMIIVGKFTHRIMCQPINRENDREALRTILKCVRLLKEDQVSIGVFPEGYTSLDAKLHPFRNGVFKIAQKAQVPVVICTVQNTRKIFHNAMHLKHTDVPVHVVDVIPAADTKGITAVELGSRVHRKMADDLGPDNVLKQPETEETP